MAKMASMISTAHTIPKYDLSRVADSRSDPQQPKKAVKKTNRPKPTMTPPDEVGGGAEDGQEVLRVAKDDPANSNERYAQQDEGDVEGEQCILGKHRTPVHATLGHGCSFNTRGTGMGRAGAVRGGGRGRLSA